MAKNNYQYEKRLKDLAKKKKKEEKHQKKLNRTAEKKENITDDIVDEFDKDDISGADYSE